MERNVQIMNRLIAIFIVSTLVAGASLVSAAPPKVVKAMPDNGQENVDPATTEIRIEFDQPMSTAGRSIVGGGETFPKTVGNPRWLNPRTMIIPVKLEPGHEYWLSINSDSFKNFTNKAGESAEPYPISFVTAKAGAAANVPASAPAGANTAAIAALRKAIDDNYAYRDRVKLDWAKEFAAHQSKLEAARSANEFAREAASLLRAAQDAHVFVKAGATTIGTYPNAKPPNFNLDTLRKLVPAWTESQAGIVTGKFPDRIGYLLIPTWAEALPPAVESALGNLKECRAIIIDVRCNGGGDEPSAKRVAGLFVTEPKVYAKNRNRRDGQWAGPFDRILEPRKDAPHEGRPVALLIGPKVASSCESFVLMMKQSPRCTLIGTATKGSSGNPKPSDLGNGVVVYLSSWEDQLPDGTLLEGNGVASDIEIKTRLAELLERDPVLDAALQKLREVKI